MQNNTPIHPALAWMIVITNQLINMGVATTSDGGVVMSQGKALRPPKKISVNDRDDIDHRKRFGKG